MTLPQRRRTDRPRGRARLRLTGDFPDNSQPGTELIRDVQPGDWNAAPAFDGASGAGLPEADPAAGLRQAIELTAMAGRGTGEPSQEHPHGHFTGIGDQTTWHPAPGYRERRGIPPAPPPAAPQPDPRDTGPMQRLPRVERLRARPRPQRPADDFIPVWSEAIRQHVMECGQQHLNNDVDLSDDDIDLSDGRYWRRCERRWADPIAAKMPFAFEALRQSAYVMGWRLDAFTRWACPPCQLTPAYWSPRQVVQWDRDAADAYLNGRPDGEHWHRAAAEHDLIRDVADHAGNGKHRAVTR